MKKIEECRRETREHNKAIGVSRIIIEHVFNGVKRLKEKRNKVRLKTGQIRDNVMKAAVALHNLRIGYRALQNNS